MATQTPIGARQGSQAPPDPRFANTRCIIEHIAAFGDDLLDQGSRVWVSPFDIEREMLAERVLELFEWSIWDACSLGEVLESVVVAEREGLRGESQSPARQLPSGEDLRLVARRVSRDAAWMGFDATTEEPRIEALLYGVPGTPAGLVLARHLGASALEDATDLSHARLSVVRAGPTSEEVAEVRRLAALVAENSPSLLALARSQVAFQRNPSAVGDVGRRLAARAFGRVADEVAASATEPHTRALLRATLGEISGIADARLGDYEACEIVLASIADQAEQDMASVLEHSLDDPRVLTRALILRARIANHRGDSVTAMSALALALAAAQREPSVRMMMLEVDISTYYAVAAQCLWPYEKSDAMEAGAMEQAVSWLEPVIRRLVELTESLARGDASIGSIAAAPLDLGTKGREPQHARPEPTLGAALGTLGRAHAFLGHHDKATWALLESRARFPAEIDRAVNLTFLAQVELDRSHDFDPARLATILARMIEPQRRGPRWAVDRLLARDGGFRFILNVLLKALARDARVVGSEAIASWLDALEQHGPESLHALLSRMRSHPTELVARHAGELLVRHERDDEAAARWFTLGVEVGREGGATMQRVARFTEHLARHGAPVTSDPRGSIFNPSYEYR